MAKCAHDYASTFCCLTEEEKSHLLGLAKVHIPTLRRKKVEQGDAEKEVAENVAAPLKPTSTGRQTYGSTGKYKSHPVEGVLADFRE